MNDNDKQTLESRLENLIRDHEEKLHSGYGHWDMAEQIRHIIREYERNAADAILDAQHFQTDMTMWLQGLALCCHMVSNGQTHAEKDARMRGLVEMIESAVHKVKEYDWKLSRMNRRSYRPDDLFNNDYPVRYFKERAERAERELKELKGIKDEQPTDTSSDDSYVPF